MTRRSLAWIRPWRLAALCLLPGLVAGCHAPRNYLVCNFADEYAKRGPVSTASVDLSRAHEGAPSAFHRDSDALVRRCVDGSVLHGPLYFEDPFEDAGSDDGQFAWTAEDSLFWLAWPGRFLLNGSFLPFSAITTPPWYVMVSDGHLSQQIPGKIHDATRWHPPESVTR